MSTEGDTDSVLIEAEGRFMGRVNWPSTQASSEGVAFKHLIEDKLGGVLQM